MKTASSIKPTHQAVKVYYDTLSVFAAHGIAHEGATETAFSRLLADTAKSLGWTLIPKQGKKVGGKMVYPDGTLRDVYNLPRGYWEAKDTDDDLDVEIRKKIEKKYPLTNTIFEGTSRAVLYQNGIVTREYDLTDPQQLADLLNQFYGFTEPDIEGFEQAIGEFKERVPELARGLAEKIKHAHDNNEKFQTTFAEFFQLCQTALNPNIRQEAVDEMLVQHLLTERLFRRIFHDEEFTRRNVIAAEVEKVIAALVSRSFSRDEFLKSLDRFYKAIEQAAETIEDFNEKQHFLNTVYERFFQGYSVKVADTHGIVYTPQPIVDFMCASVEEVLKDEFGLSLGSPGVTILDPCTGTGNFVVNLLRRISGKDLPRVYREQLFANEVMLLPYYIAALNIEHAYYERTGRYEAFEGLCFVDTLDLAEAKQKTLEFFSEKNTERVERQKKTPITVIIGNPPYNVGQLDENDNNRNRKYKVIEDRIRQTYVKDSRATLRAQVYDPYVKFFRWAADRISANGVVCLVTNNSFADQIVFDGMRKHLMQDFTRIYHLHMEGNVRLNPHLSGTAYNVFGIQVGVGITIAIKSQKHEDHRLFFHRLDKTLRRANKYQWLADHQALNGVTWEQLIPDDRHTWLVCEHGDEFEQMIPIGSKEGKATDRLSVEAVFKSYCRGIASNADAYVYDFHREWLKERAARMVEDFNSKLDRWQRKGHPENLEEFLQLDEKVHKWIRKTKKVLLRGKHVAFNESNLRLAQYRPFTRQWHFLDRSFNEDLYSIPAYVPMPASVKENRIIVVTDIASRAPSFSTLCVCYIADLHLCASVDSHQCFPFYLYDEDGTNRRENLTDWALKHFQTRYKSKKITKWDVFYYVYGLLHHPRYRTKFADNLKRDLPRIPFAPDFKAFGDASWRLAELHLNYETLDPYPLKFVESPNVPLSYVVTDKMKLSQDKASLRVNDSLTLAGIPPEVFGYRLGNRSALEWVIDQYRVSEDARSGILSDPNRRDDPEYIVRLVGQVVRVSMETVRNVAGLPEVFST